MGIRAIRYKLRSGRGDMSITTIRELLWSHDTARVSYEDKYMYYERSTQEWIVMQRHGKQENCIERTHTEEWAIARLMGRTL